MSKIENKSKQPSIDQMVKEFLLSSENAKPWRESLKANLFLHFTGDLAPEQKIRLNYQKYHPLSRLTSEEIIKLTLKEIAKELYILDTEDQDDITRQLPTKIREDFWNLIEQGKNSAG